MVTSGLRLAFTDLGFTLFTAIDPYCIAMCNIILHALSVYCINRIPEYEDMLVVSICRRPPSVIGIADATPESPTHHATEPRGRCSCVVT